MLTVNEVIEAVKESPLWEMLSQEEQIEAINYALEAAGLNTEHLEEIVGASTG